MNITRRPARCRTQKVGEVNIVKLTGRLTPDEQEDLLLKTVNKLVSEGEKFFLLDLSGVNYINSTGVGSLIQCLKTAQDADGDLKLLNPSQAVSQIIQVSKLDSIFKSYTDLDSAVSSFKNPEKRTSSRSRKSNPEE
ncbi:MAG: STAS domain-containing protein [Blastocatellia bacterium]|nr:STAS domain-containing protein [Blastocatellia bacterium]